MKHKSKHIAFATASLAMALMATTAQAQKVTIDFEDVKSLADTKSGAPAAGAPVAPNDGNVVTYGAPGKANGFNTEQSSQGFNFNWKESGPGTVIPNLPIFTHGHLANHAAIDIVASNAFRAFNNDVGTGGGTDFISPRYLVTDNTQDALNSLTISDATPNTTFTLQSFKAAKVFNAGQTAKEITVTGNVNGGSTVVNTFNLDLFSTIVTGTGGLDDALFATFTLGTEFFNVDLDSVIFEGFGSTTNDDNFFAIDDIIVNDPDALPPPVVVAAVSEPSSLAMFGFSGMVFGWVARRRRLLAG